MMTDLEYTTGRMNVNEQVLHALLLAVGGALPHLQNRLEHMLEEWDRVLNELDAKKAADAAKESI
jgi:hypothetical protein